MGTAGWPCTTALSSGIPEAPFSCAREAGDALAQLGIAAFPLGDAPNHRAPNPLRSWLHPRSRAWREWDLLVGKNTPGNFLPLVLGHLSHGGAGHGGEKAGAASLSPPCPPRSPCCPVSQKRGKQKKKRGAGRSLTETSSNFLGGEKPYSDGKNSRSEVVTKQPAAIRQGPGAWARNKATSLPTQSHGWPGCRGRRCPAEPRAPGCSGRLPRLALEGGQSPLGCPSRGGRLLLGKDLGSAPNPMMAPHGSGAHTGLEVIPDRGMLNFG